LRILIVSQYFWPENFRINDLAISLTKRGHEITILTGVPNYPDGKVFKDFSLSPKKFENFKGVSIVRVPLITRGSSNVRLFLNYISYAISASIFGLWKIRKKSFDVIFVYQPSPITSAIPAIIIKYIKKLPLAIWVLDIWPDSLKAVKIIQSKFLLKIIGYLVSFIYKNCNLILVQSSSFAPKIRKYVPNKIPINYFPGWADLVFQTSSKKKAAEIVQDNYSFNIMFAGNIGDAQDFDAILASAVLLKNNKNIKWYILGKGRKFSWVKEQVKHLGLEDVFFMMGQFPPERMASFFAHADALLITLRSHPLFAITIPAKVQTYLASGKPILAMLDGEGASILDQSESGIVVPSGDFRGLANAISLMSNMSSKSRKKFGLNGILFSKKEFNRTALISKLEGYLRDLK
jgi:glycosyltransferase involved in cell wall biosynthesis